jgi:hypothetical protein
VELKVFVEVSLSLTLHKIARLKNWAELLEAMVKTLSPEEMKVMRDLCISRREAEQDLNSIRQMSYLIFLIDNRQYMETLMSKRRQG